MSTQFYRTKAIKIAGSDFKEVHSRARISYSKIKQRSKRKSYIRSAYFNKEKIFLDLFWHHLFEKKNWRDRMRRLQYFDCAVELIQKSKIPPTIKRNPNNCSEILHRFVGKSRSGKPFKLQIKQTKNNTKYLISVYPFKQKRTSRYV